MKIRHDNQLGFSTFEVFMVIAVFVIIGTIGVTVYHYHTKKHVAIITVTSENQPTTQQKTLSPSQTKTLVPAPTYLNITQWGVELPLSSAISDAYYEPIPGLIYSDGQPSVIGLGLTSLNSSCGVISTAIDAGYSNSLGAILRAPPTATDPISGELLTQKYPGGATINGYYYGYISRTSGNACASSSTFQTINSAFITATEDMVSD